MDCLTPLLTQIFHDSSISKSIKLKRTKNESIVKNKLVDEKDSQ